MGTATNPATHSLAMTVDGLVKVLRPVLSAPGWSTDLGLLHAAGEVLSMPVMTTKYEVSDDAPNTTALGLTLTEKQRDACKAAVTHFGKAGKLPCGPHVNLILEGLGLV